MEAKRTSIIPLLALFIFWFSACYAPPKHAVKTTPAPAEEHIQQTREKEMGEKTGEEDKILEEEKANPSSLLEQAIEAYQDAQSAWEKGDFDTALATLDEAYNILLSVNLPPDSPLHEEKDSLRLLIAQRIQEIYGSRVVAVGDNNMSIPLVENEFVKEEIKIFQTKEKKFFLEGYKRSGMYRPMIISELKQAGLPEQLSWIPLIESWFKVRAYSRARALGLWQFISSTGYRFGLKRDTYVDERMDPVKSTTAAIKYLSELHSLFGDWTTALAAYNCGEFRVQKVIRTQRINYLDNFWDLYIMLPRETARFVPRFIAALIIINNPEKYGFELPEPDNPLEYETIIFNRPIQLSALSRKLGLDENELKLLNPELRYDATPNYEYSLKVPLGTGSKALMAVHSLPQWIPPETTFFWHTVRRGETLSGIARRYGTTVSQIARLNRLRRVHFIRQGQKLKIPGKGMITSRRTSSQVVQEGKQLVYIVKRGDSLYRIAHMFGTRVEKIKKLNNLQSHIIKVGQKLIIQSAKPKEAITYVVQRGDTPYDIAKKFGMNLEILLTINGLTQRSKIYPGQKLWVIPRK